MGSFLANKLGEYMNMATDNFANKYSSFDDVNKIWLGELDLDSKHDYAVNYLAPDVVSNWGNLGVPERQQYLREAVRRAQGDDDDSFGEKVMKKGVPLATAALTAYAAPALIGKFAGAGAGAIPGGGALAPAATSGGFWDKIGLTKPETALDWLNLIGKGAGVASSAAGLIGGMRGAGKTQPPPMLDTGQPTTLPQATFERTRQPMPQNLTNYGKTGGEHLFFEEGGRTPDMGTGGREDDIEAMLSGGEYVMDAETVALLGDGSTETGFAKLDELRQRIRQHKGQALAKGKFSPDAKDPMEYMGMSKGGRIRGDWVRRVINGGALNRGTEELDSVRRLKDAYANRPDTSAADRERALASLDPSSREKLENLKRQMQIREERKRSGLRVAKAKGGGVDLAGARTRVESIKKLAKSVPADPVAELSAFADRLESAIGKGDELTIKGVEAEIPQFQDRFAKGGRVRSSIDELLSRHGSVQRSPEDLKKIAEELRKLHPQSEALRQYDFAQQNRKKLTGGK